MWSFETDPDYVAKLDWAGEFVRTEIEPIDALFHQDQIDNPGNQSMRAILGSLMQQVRDQGMWASHLPPSLGGNGYGQVKLAQFRKACILEYKVAASMVGNLPEAVGRYFAPLVTGLIEEARVIAERASKERRT